MGANYEETTDSELIRLTREGDSLALEFLISKYKNSVKIKARSYFFTGADFDDVLQEGMIGLFKAVRDYDGKSAAFSTFAELCITRQIITAVKRSTRQKHLPLNTYLPINRFGGEPTPEAEPLLDTTAEPLEQLIIREAMNNIESGIARELSAFERGVLALYLRGDSYTDISVQLGKSEKSIDNALQRIRKKIGRIIGRTKRS